jgi:hypothetical protein
MSTGDKAVLFCAALKGLAALILWLSLRRKGAR